MKRLLLPLAAVAIAGLIGPVGVRPAYACSAGPDWDPIAESDIIVGGRITGWELIEKGQDSDPKTGEPVVDGPYDPIRVEMAVARVYKGSAPANIRVIDAASLLGDEWVGASGACGPFDSDPTGMYFIMGLRIDDLDRYRPNRLLVFHAGQEPAESYDDLPLSYLAPLLPGALPTSGGPPPEVAPSSSAAPGPALVALGLALLAGGGWLTLRALRRA